MCLQLKYLYQNYCRILLLQIPVDRFLSLILHPVTMYPYSRFFLILVVWIHVIISSTGYSQVPQRYLESAANNNPLLKSEFSIYKSELEKVAQAGSLPDPEINMGFFVMPMERFMGNQVASISVMQMFPWFGTLGDAKNEAAEMAKGSFQNFNEIKSQLFYEVKESYYDLYLLEKEIKVTLENQKILKSVESVALANYISAGIQPTGKKSMEVPANTSSSTNSGGGSGMSDMDGSKENDNNDADRGGMENMNTGMGSGSGTMVDVLRIQIELKQLENEHEKLLDSRNFIRQKFYQLTGISSAEEIEFPDSLMLLPPPVPLSEIADSLKANNPMLQMLAAEEKAYIAMVSMNKKMGLPMFGIGIQYEIFSPRQSMGHSDVLSDMNGRNMLMPMVSLTLPIWRKKYSAAVNKSELLKQATKEKIEDSGQKLYLSYEELLKEYRISKRDYQFALEQSRLARQSLNIMVTEYSTGKGNFEELLRMQQQLLSIQINKEISARANHLVVAGMERLMGR